MPHMRCPICEGTEFGNYNGRPVASCLRCRSLERGRLQYLILERLRLPRPHSRILHVAPEPHLFKIFSESSGDKYHPCDYDISHRNYTRLGSKIYEIDLCRDIFRFPSECFDLVLHNHVLEHVPCSVPAILEEHKRIIAPGGYFVFSVPFRFETTEEDLSETLTEDDRLRLFGQSDHMRIFGTKDFPEKLTEIFGENILFDTSVWTDEFLESYAIPASLARRISGVTNFVWRKPH